MAAFNVTFDVSTRHAGTQAWSTAVSAETSDEAINLAIEEADRNRFINRVLALVERVDT